MFEDSRWEVFIWLGNCRECFDFLFIIIMFYDVLSWVNWYWSEILWLLLILRYMYDFLKFIYGKGGWIKGRGYYKINVRVIWGFVVDFIFERFVLYFCGLKIIFKIFSFWFFNVYFLKENCLIFYFFRLFVFYFSGGIFIDI